MPFKIFNASQKGIYKTKYDGRACDNLVCQKLWISSKSILNGHTGVQISVKGVLIVSLTMSERNYQHKKIKINLYSCVAK